MKATDGLSERYLTPLRSDLECFARDFKQEIADVTGAEIDDWLRGLRHDGAPVSGRTRNNLRTSIGTLFSYFLGANDPYSALKTTLRAEINPEAWATLNRDTSCPFPKPARGRIAVKVINHLGDEVMKVFRV